MILYGTFEERGYKFEAYIPDDDAEPVAFDLRIIVGPELKYAMLLPMTYVPTFGVDVGDIQSLESTLDRCLQILPDACEFGPYVVATLDRLEADIGGKSLRERHQASSASARQGHGQFEYTAELFASKFATLMGGRKSMDRWMQTKLPAFGERTPEEALRLGMTQDVVNYLLQLHADRDPIDGP